MNYEIIDVDLLGRLGKISINNKVMVTPNLFPVVHPIKNTLHPRILKELGAQAIFTNAYIMFQREDVKEEVLKKKVHRYLDFDGFIATDSGAFQQYMYGHKNMPIKAEEIEIFQENIESDFPVILDVPVQLDDNYKTAKKKVLTTIERARNNIFRRKNANCNWFAPIHGAQYPDLVALSTLEMNKLDFNIFAIGGIVKAFLDYRFDITLKILLNVKKNILSNKLIHMFGLGLPQFFSLAVACGCDLMDSAAYVLYAKENRYFTLSTGTKNLEDLDEFPCSCPVCCEYSPREIKALENAEKTKLLAKHNLYISFSELRTIRQAIREGKLWELVEQRIRGHPSLVNGVKVVKEHLGFIEKYEKIYKKHGQLYSSYESLSRPLNYRYEKKSINHYIPPKDSRFLIILPELDVKGKNSTTMKKWLAEISENSIIKREFIHVVISSLIFGIIPLELLDTFPMGQHELYFRLEKNDIFSRNSLNKAKNFFKTFLNHYEKHAILIPDEFINQFEENTPFLKHHPLHKLNSIVEFNIPSFNEIGKIIQYFRN